MTEHYGLSGLVLYSQFILNELACYTCPPITPGPVHCNTNSVVTQLVARSCPSTTGDIGNRGVICVFGRNIVVFTHIHLFFYCVLFLNNQRRHAEVISLLTTTILSLSLNSLGCYQHFVNNFVCVATPSGSRKHFSDFRRQDAMNSSARRAMTGSGLQLPLVSATMKGAATSFRRTSFVVHMKILYCETTITNKFLSSAKNYHNL